MSPVEPRSWHHGLVARRWSLFRDSGPEIDYFRQFVEAGQPALDVACGTGRLLVPVIEVGHQGADGNRIVVARGAPCGAGQ